MRIVADRDIVALDSHFSRFGELVKLPGREINRTSLQHADILLVRSVTRVDRELLWGTPVCFVASATSGIDHVDCRWLEQQGIQFVSAPGSNAAAVVEYCLTALAWLSQSAVLIPGEHDVGIVGAGQVGGRLAVQLLSLGFTVRLCDPLLDGSARETLEAIGACFGSLPEILKCRVISLHVPLTRQGRHPTWHMLNDHSLASIQPDTVLINSSRGSVIDNPALARFLTRNPSVSAVLDVWENEPCPDPGLLQQVRLATPHIAGYSLEAKQRATAVIARAIAGLIGLSPVSDEESDPMPELLDLENRQDPGNPLLPEILLRCLPLDQLSHSLKSLGPDQLASGFDALRRQQVNRREFSAYRLARANLSPEQQQFARRLGFSLGFSGSGRRNAPGC